MIFINTNYKQFQSIYIYLKAYKRTVISIYLRQMQAKKTKAICRQANGRWSPAQHNRFLKGLEKYGRDWQMIKNIVKTRTKTQVRSHAQKLFQKFTEEDLDAMMMEEDEQYEERQKQSSLCETQNSIPSDSKTVTIEELRENMRNYKFGSNFLTFLQRNIL